MQSLPLPALGLCGAPGPQGLCSRCVCFLVTNEDGLEEQNSFLTFTNLKGIFSLTYDFPPFLKQRARRAALPHLSIEHCILEPNFSLTSSSQEGAQGCFFATG